jgi:ATP-binding protein involved in chromosome partitioning
MRAAAEKTVAALPGVASVTVILSAERAPAKAPATSAHPTAAAGRKIEAPGVAAIVAIVSGKGGVGKSTLSVNLAVALRRQGLAVGLLDADIYGPSLPLLMGLSGKPRATAEKKLEPLIGYGVACMSIGFLMDEAAPAIWRGPMVVGALQQLLRDVAWGKLDVLLVDMPPGTGDVALTMAQSVSLTGVVIVSTPQDVALADARKGLNMFRRVDVPVLGLVENMSYFACPHCGERSDIFGHGGARREAEKLGVDFLGEIPLHLSIRETSDAGTPIVEQAPNSPEAAAFAGIAARLREKLGQRTRKAPSIVIE